MCCEKRSSLHAHAKKRDQGLGFLQSFPHNEKILDETLTVGTFVERLSSFQRLFCTRTFGLSLVGRFVPFRSVLYGSCTYFATDVVREGFSSSGLPTTDDRPFQSHLTLAKMSAANREDRVALRNRIPPPAYESFLDAGFGEQVVEGLELLSMTHPADEGGYYHCFSKCPF